MLPPQLEPTFRRVTFGRPPDYQRTLVWLFVFGLLCALRDWWRG